MNVTDKDWQQFCAKNPLAAMQMEVIILERVLAEKDSLIEQLQAIQSNGASREPVPVETE